MSGRSAMKVGLWRKLSPSLVIALAITGVGLDALPTSLILDVVCSEDLRDDCTDDLDDVFDVTWLESPSGPRPQRMAPRPGEACPSLPPPIPGLLRRTAEHAANSGAPPRRLSTL